MNKLSKRPLRDLTDVTLADEDTKLTMPIGQSKAMWLNWWDNL